MTDEDEARTRLLDHYRAKIAIRRADLVRSDADQGSFALAKQKAKNTKLTNEIADLAEKIERLSLILTAK